jgi:hypothetical protein
MSEECRARLIWYFLIVAKSFSCTAASGTAIRADFFGCLKRIAAMTCPAFAGPVET